MQTTDTPPALAPVIPDDAVFTYGTLRVVLGCSARSLPREVRKGRLRAARRLGRTWILGSWVKEWLRGGEVHQAGVNGCAGKAVAQ